MATPKRAKSATPKTMKIAPGFMVDDKRNLPSKRKTVPFLEQGDIEVKMAAAEVTNADISLPKQLTNLLIYGSPVSAELEAIMQDHDKFKEFLEDNDLDLGILRG
jgi:hypothetical protein